jgi:hypothetical protein
MQKIICYLDQLTCFPAEIRCDELPESVEVDGVLFVRHQWSNIYHRSALSFISLSYTP